MTLEDILKLEDEADFNAAFAAYNELYEHGPSDFNLWKHYYFFLWAAIEDAPLEFRERVNLGQNLQKMYDEGKTQFRHLSDFKFIAGYTITIFPYEFGNYEDLEKEGKELLRQAHEEEPDNKIYRMVYLGSLETVGEEYSKAEIEAGPVVLNKFSGPGLMNNYFSQVLNRKR